MEATAASAISLPPPPLEDATGRLFCMVQARWPACQSKSEPWPLLTPGGEHFPFSLMTASSGQDEHEEQEHEDDIVRVLFEAVAAS